MSDNLVNAIESPVEVERRWVGVGVAVEMQLVSLSHGDVSGHGVLDGEVGDGRKEDAYLPLVLQRLLRHIFVDSATTDEQVVMLRSRLKSPDCCKDLAVRTLGPPHYRKLS